MINKIIENGITYRCCDKKSIESYIALFDFFYKKLGNQNYIEIAIGENKYELASAMSEKHNNIAILKHLKKTINKQIKQEINKLFNERDEAHNETK